MALNYGNRIVDDSIVFHLDFANRKCFAPNILNYSHWTVGSGGVSFDGTRYGVTIYSDNSLTGENSRVVGADPFGYGSSIVWRSQNSDTTDPTGDGGFDTGNFTIDNSKLYRFSVWTKRDQMAVGPTTSGQFYLGHFGKLPNGGVTFSVNKSTGVPFGNPYFHVTPNPNPSNLTAIQPPFLGGINTWTLVVGHVWPVGTSTGANLPGTNINGLASNPSHPDSGVWTRKIDSELNYWKADGNAIDSLKGVNGIIATPQPSGPTWSLSSMTYLSGIEGSAFSFSGSNFVVLPDNTLNYTGDFSAGLWFFAPSGMTNSNLISCFDNRGDFTSYNGWTIGVNTTSMSISFSIAIRMGFPGNPSSQYFSINLATPSGAFSYNSWTHVLVTRKSGARSRIYVNGTLVASDTNIYGPSYIPQGYGSNTAYIGARYYGFLDGGLPGPYFYAAPAGLKIDEVRTFSEELSSSQAAVLTSIKQGKIGNLIDSGDWVWYPSAVRASHRAYLFYAGDNTSVQSFIYPRVDVVDGLEPTIEELLAGPEPVRDLANHNNILYPLSTTDFDMAGRGLNFRGTEASVVRGNMSATFSAQTVSVWFSTTATIGAGIPGMNVLQFGPTSSTNYFVVSVGEVTGGATNEVVSVITGLNDVGGTLNMTYFASTTFAFQAGLWYNLVLSWSGTKYLMYINGVEVATLTGGGGFGNRHAALYANVTMAHIGSAAFTSGGIFYPYGSNFNGKIGSVLVYGRSLTPSEVLDNFNNMKRKYGL